MKPLDNDQQSAVNTYLQQVQAQVDEERTRNIKLSTEISQRSGLSSDEATPLIKLQLELESTLDGLFHLLSGHVVRVISGTERWGEPSDDRIKVFSDYGVKQIMTSLRFYMNINNLMSYYEMDDIRSMVYEFGDGLNDLLLCRYEDFFYYPTPEELYDRMYPLMVAQRDMKVNEEELYQKCIIWSQEELQSRINHYPTILTSLIHTVYTTLLRAYKGKERDTLRRYTHVSENNGGGQPIKVEKRMIGKYG